MKKIYHKIKRIEQPTEITCGPSSLAQLLNFYHEKVSAEEIASSIDMIEGLGTFDSHLGQEALKRGHKAIITTQNLYVFDPTWFNLPEVKLLDNLQKTLSTIKDPILQNCISGFIGFLEKGGGIEFKPISKELIINKIEKNPILVGLCSTYLYREKRPKSSNRLGHFVVVNGYDPESSSFFITDPWYNNPFCKSGKYQIHSNELITAIHLGEATYDCSILEI